MHVLRRQLPVYSPLTPRAIAGGLRGVVGSRKGLARELEAALAERFGARGVLLTDSGTTALRIALQATTSQGRAALPAYSCYDVATAADGAACDVVLYDLDPSTLGPDLESLRQALRLGVSAVVIAPLYGIPVDMAAIEPLVGEAGATIVEDAAQGAGATLDGRVVGSFGSLSLLSFGRGKGVTGGGGGALLSHDSRGDDALEVAGRLLAVGGRGLRQLPAMLAQWAMGRPGLYGLPSAMPFLRLGETLYRPPWPPRAASGLTVGAVMQTLKLADAEADIRRAIAGRFTAVARDGGHVGVPRPPERATPGYLRFPVLCSDTTWATLGTMGRFGVMPGYPTALADLAGFATRVRNAGQGFPGARMLARRLATLPTHSRVSAADLEALVDWLR